ncbi:MAG: glycogen debranching enzyme GlgX, partial [Cupriavidus sp.]|nr:glycogen debranching enzyme GlgX [Cupriavidus sp.]
AYCQYNELSWLNWDDAAHPSNAPMRRVVSRLLALRRQLPVLTENRFVHGRSQPAPGLPDIAWFGPDGNELTSEQWANPEDRTLALRRATHCAQEEVEVIVLCLNASHEDVVFRMPAPGEDWNLLFDSTAPDLEDEPVSLDDEGRPAYKVPARGLALLVAAVPKDEDPSR